MLSHTQHFLVELFPERKPSFPPLLHPIVSSFRSELLIERRFYNADRAMSSAAAIPQVGRDERTILKNGTNCWTLRML